MSKEQAILLLEKILSTSKMNIALDEASAIFQALQVLREAK